MKNTTKLTVIDISRIEKTNYFLSDPHCRLKNYWKLGAI